jgi:hypothetical protein
VRYVCVFTAHKSHTGDLQVTFVVLVVYYVPLEYSPGEPYPDWSLSFGIALSLFSMLCIPGYAIFHLIFIEKGSFMEVRPADGSSNCSSLIPAAISIVVE